ncbi:cupin domain-containing protein [Nocardia goodfellowii]|uniref:Cupin superfamily sugar epimerase n=1 Tax=Nocardia goodfellowii TaxID=882446 RepID=A0ABS4QN36_9NOCA|nr:cupin domain-containing protein [Nocardia goodfellowii]MBP2193114.1 putative cupin superfamily sugar epimerase [Nocardia goodfellowii]
MLTMMTYHAWRASQGNDGPAEGHSVAHDGEALEYANKVLTDVGEPVVVVEKQSGITPRVRFLYQDLSGRFTEIMARPALAETLDLVPHPEGGWAQSIWSSSVTVAPEGYPGERASATALHYVLGPGDRSRWHRVRSDELWFWQRGGSLRFLTGGDGDSPAVAPDTHTLGPELDAGERLHILIRGGIWMAAEPLSPSETLIACVVSPGFDHDDYQIL